MSRPQVELPQLSPVSCENANASTAVKRLMFKDGQLLDEKFVLQKKINEGGLGAVYEVSMLDVLDKRYALKLTLTQNTQLVRMEAGLVRRLSKLNPCFAHFYQFGTIEGLPYFVMDLLGLSLGDVQLRMPDEKFMTKTVVRVGLQILNAIETIHSCFLIHRDIKPGLLNMAIGLNNPRQIYLFDFGLSRRFVQKSHGDRLDFRPERVKAPFRGTYNYCSSQQQKFKDTCRRDDLWSFMCTLIELVTGCLPWEHDKHKIERIKQETPISILLQGCPLIFEALLKYLDKLEFYSHPSYDFFRKAFRLIMSARRYNEKDPYDWKLRQRLLGVHANTDPFHKKPLSTVVHTIALLLTRIQVIYFWKPISLNTLLMIEVDSVLSEMFRHLVC